MCILGMDYKAVGYVLDETNEPPVLNRMWHQPHFHGVCLQFTGRSLWKAQCGMSFVENGTTFPLEQCDNRVALLEFRRSLGTPQ